MRFFCWISPDFWKIENFQHKISRYFFRSFFSKKKISGIFKTDIPDFDNYTSYIDTGDHVVIINARLVKLTGQKETQKLYRRHSGYPGGLREDRLKVVRKNQPVRLVESAVRGMLPKTKLGAAMYRKLKVYAGSDHPHAAQKPSVLEVL